MVTCYLGPRFAGRRLRMRLSAFSLEKLQPEECSRVCYELVVLLATSAARPSRSISPARPSRSQSRRPRAAATIFYGRLVAPATSAVTCRQSTVVPQNMPGAGSLIAANWLANVAPKDGTAIAIILKRDAVENLPGNARARFDARASALDREPQRLHSSCGGLADTHRSRLRTISSARSSWSAPTRPPPTPTVWPLLHQRH